NAIEDWCCRGEKVCQLNRSFDAQILRVFAVPGYLASSPNSEEISSAKVSADSFEPISFGSDRIIFTAARREQSFESACFASREYDALFHRLTRASRLPTSEN